MKTIAELEKYLEEECYSFYAITIGKHMAPEGFVIKQDGQEYIYGYSERGFLRTIKASESEEELVNYALKDLASYKWNRAHLVARMWSEYDAAEAERELSRMPLPTAWNTVENIMPTAAGKKHRLINLSAGIPIAYISSVALNIAKSSLGNT